MTEETATTGEREKYLQALDAQADYYIGSFNPGEREDIADIKREAKRLIITISDACPKGRRTSAAFTHIEEASMLAVKSLFEGA